MLAALLFMLFEPFTDTVAASVFTPAGRSAPGYLKVSWVADFTLAGKVMVAVDTPLIWKIGDAAVSSTDGVVLWL
jgi:hypothetical protein